MILDKHVSADGKVSLWDLGDGKEDIRKIMLPHIDAAHALNVEPQRFAVVDPEDPETPPGQKTAEPEPDDPSKFGGETAL